MATISTERLFEYRQFCFSLRVAWDYGHIQLTGPVTTISCCKSVEVIQNLDTDLVSSDSRGIASNNMCMWCFCLIGGRTVIVCLQVSNLVPGDIVTLSTGSVVPADMRIVVSMGLQSDRGLLTGESQPVR